VLIGVLGAALRLPMLDARPLHGDEALNTIKFRDLWLGRGYIYDPHEYHGPTLPYVTLPAVWLSGEKDFASTSEATYRRVDVAFGLGVIVLTLLLTRAVGPSGALVAGLLVAVSPAMTFYSRYYIHEMLLVFFTAGAIACVWKYVDAVRSGGKRSLLWAAMLGGCFALMHATKETAAMSAVAMAVAALVTWFTSRDKPAIKQLLSPPAIAALFGTELVITIVLFSSFFTHWRGVVDSVLTYLNYLHRGTGGEPLHLHPWWWYIELLTWRSFRGVTFTEAFIVAMAVFGLVLGWRRPFGRFIGIYTLVLLVIYSAIPYKTPWSILSVLWGMCVLGGVAVDVIVARASRPAGALVALIVLVGAGNLGWQAYRANFIFHTDPRNPYVYAHPVSDMRRMVTRLGQIADVSPKHHDMTVLVISGVNYWPLPFYLRDFNRVGFYATVPANAAADVMIVAREEEEAVAEQVGERYQIEHYALRTGVVYGVFIRRDLWDAFMSTR
jgi:uncharacterized protein (TIGR03663 family)